MPKRKEHSIIPPLETEARYTVVLASGSPRRRELMNRYFQYVELAKPTGVEPLPEQGEKPNDYTLRVARMKAEQIVEHRLNTLVIAADTIVALDDDILGKPQDHQESVQMLTRLRNRKHQVTTGVIVFDSGTGRICQSTTETDVVMRDYTSDEIAQYVASGDSLDKAGGYAIQDRNFVPVVKADGCYWNVVGLPVCALQLLLVQAGHPDILRADRIVSEECSNCNLGEV